MFEELEKLIIEKFGTKKRFVNRIGWNYQTLKNKLCGRTSFTTEDIFIFVKTLNIKKGEIAFYFLPGLFTEKTKRKTK